jgi:putative peptidoglycan lipid II flippase
MNFFRSVFSVGAFTVVSRITGYLRELLVAHFIGVDAVTDALAITIKLPSFFRRLFAEGAFHVSFLPVFAKSGKDKTFAGMVLSLLVAGVGLLVLVVTGYFDSITESLFSNLASKPETLAYVVKLGPIIFPYIFFISLVSFFGSILNAYGRFSLLASSHAIGNIAVIAYVLIGQVWTQDYSILFAWGILISGAIQLAVIMVGCWVGGYIVLPRWPHMTPLVKTFLKKFFPGMLGVGVIQLNILVGVWLASGLPKGSISYLYFADRLNQLPLSIVGVSLSSVLLPLLSQQLRTHDVQGANRTQNQALRFASLLMIPASLVLISLAFPLIYLLFGHGKVEFMQLREIAKTLIAFGFGIPAYIFIKILNTRFFAQGKTTIPLIGSGIGVVVDIAVALALIGSLGHLGIALAVSVSAWANVLFLIFVLHRSYGWTVSRSMWMFWGKSLIAGAGLIAVVLTFQKYLPSFYAFGVFKQIWLVSGVSGAGILTFFLILVAIGGISKRQVLGLWKSGQEEEDHASKS